VEAVQGPLILERFSLPFIAPVYIETATAECLTILGDFAAAKTSAQKAFEIAELADHQLSLHFAYRALGAVHLGRGEAQEALRWLELGLDLCREGKFPLGFSWIAGEVGRAYTLTGRISEALDVLQQR
jgi:tetratricopeptide (TPR) repeat protein